MRTESMFVIGLAVAVLMLFLTIVFIIACVVVTIYEAIDRRIHRDDVDEELQRVIDAARMGGSQVLDDE